MARLAKILKSQSLMVMFLPVTSLSRKDSLMDRLCTAVTDSLEDDVIEIFSKSETTEK